MNVTRYVTGDVRRESRDPYRTEPDRTGPTAFLWSPNTTSSSSVTRENLDEVVSR